MVGMPRPVIFDLYNTVIDGADDERDRVLGEMSALLGVTPAALVAEYRRSWADRLVRWTVEETIQIIAGRLGIEPTPDQVAGAAKLRRGLPGRLFDLVSDETLAVLDGLRADGHRLALCSNATSESAEAWPHGPLARRFDAVVFSSAVGVAKPDPAIYHLTAGRLGAEPAQCVFVGDGADNELAGAAGVGMTVVRTVEYQDKLPDWSGPVIGRLADLPRAMAGLSSV